MREIIEYARNHFSQLKNFYEVEIIVWLDKNNKLIYDLLLYFMGNKRIRLSDELCVYPTELDSLYNLINMCI